MAEEKEKEKKLSWDNLPAGTEVQVTGDHPNKGANAKFIYRSNTGNLFVNPETDERFFVLDEKNVKYI